MGRNSNHHRNDIISVQLLGVTSQCVDYKLHAILNYQEDIYANVYSFFVTYADGTSQTIRTYDDNEVSLYMNYVNKPSVSKQDEEVDNSCLDKLSKLSDLHEAGIIPNDLFEEKKNELLERLKGNELNLCEKVKSNGVIQLVRSSQIAGSGVRIEVRLDGVKICRLAKSESFSIETSMGIHSLTVSFGKKTVSETIELNEKSPQKKVNIKVDTWDCTPIIQQEKL